MNIFEPIVRGTNPVAVLYKVIPAGTSDPYYYCIGAYERMDGSERRNYKGKMFVGSELMGELAPGDADQVINQRFPEYAGRKTERGHRIVSQTQFNLANQGELAL